MPRANRRPLDERARARLRDAQRQEADAVAAVHAAVLQRESIQDKLDAVVARHQDAIDKADRSLSHARAHLVSVSGIGRAALLLEQPVAALRAAVRATADDIHEEPA